jgi:hypothetical protein
MTDQTADTNANQIVLTNNTADAASDHLDAHIDDDQRWIKTVLASLKGRSPEAQQALMVALLDGQPAQATSIIEDRSNAVMDDRDQPHTTSCVAFPSPAPSTPQIPEIHQVPSDQRSLASVFYTELLHSDAIEGVSTVDQCLGKSRSAYLTTARWLRSSEGYRTAFNASASMAFSRPSTQNQREVSTDFGISKTIPKIMTKAVKAGERCSSFGTCQEPCEPLRKCGGTIAQVSEG